MRIKLLVVLLIIKFILIGCSKTENNSYSLDFFEVSKAKINNLQLSNINGIILEKRIDSEDRVFLFKDKESGLISSGIYLKDKYYHVDELSFVDTTEEVMGIEEVQIFGKKAIKIYGILGANYAQAFYWIIGENMDESIIQVDGHTMELDLDDDGKKEIISTLGTIPETSIYIFKGDKIYTSNINDSMGAKSVNLQDKDKKLFQVYFEPNKPEQYMYYKGSFLEK